MSTRRSMSRGMGRLQAVELYGAVRRARDVTGSVLLLALTLPLLLLVAGLIKLDSRGPGPVSDRNASVCTGGSSAC